MYALNYTYTGPVGGQTHRFRGTFTADTRLIMF